MKFIVFGIQLKIQHGAGLGGRRIAATICVSGDKALSRSKKHSVLPARKRKTFEVPGRISILYSILEH